MKITLKTLTLALLVALVAAASGINIPETAAADEPETLLDEIGGDPYQQKPISTDGETVVWFASGSENYADYHTPSQLRGARLADRDVFVIAEFPVNNQGEFVVAVDGDYVVWANERRQDDPHSNGSVIRGKRISSGEEFVVADIDSMPDLGLVADLAVSSGSGWVVWRSFYVQAWNIETGGEVQTLSRGEEESDQIPQAGYIDIDHETATWRVNSADGDFPQAVFHDLGRNRTQVLDITGAWYGTYKMGGGKILYPIESDEFLANYRLIDIESRKARTITIPSFKVPSSGEREGYLTTHALPGWDVFDGRYIVQRYAVADEEGRDVSWPFRGYDTWTDSHFPLVPDSRASDLTVSGGAMVWTTGVRNPRVHAVQLSSLLPSAPQPDPGTTDPAWLYFDETGHYLSYGFKNFWLKSGGLSVFGYPLTTEYDELNVDLDEFRTVQYTERQRFEYHPAYAGSPYETSLGRLGYADAVRRGLLDHEAFQPVADPGRSGVEYVATTGHTMEGRFRDYWRSHGLDFGDRGISYRESLALFGYPISEEFVDPYTGLRTQYFERAVFEYHPDKPEPYKVLLRRLGAEEIQQRDW
jgi:hypothetical protein